MSETIEQRTETEVRTMHDDERTTIIGATGSGKTVSGLWLLSMQPFNVRPQIILDFKGDEHINAIEGAKHVDDWSVPTKPGIYIYHPLPHQRDEVEKLLWKVWDAENIGIWVDEGYMLNKSAAFQAILTQGRSRGIPVVALVQRPAWVTRFVFSEAQFIQVFALTDERDEDTVKSFIRGFDPQQIPEYHSVYYQVKKRKYVVFKPVPSPETSLQKIASKLRSIRQRPTI